jgi:SAM-dependent methyltransferase
MFLETVDPTRTRRVAAIHHALAEHLRGSPRILDLGSGPGPLTGGILTRFPNSQVVAVDTDPVLLRVGADALHRFRRRTSWILADLREKGWTAQLPAGPIDAAVSSLALHWLEESELRALYRELRPLLRPGGVLIDGDFLPSGRPRAAPKAGEDGSRPRGSPARVRAFKARWARWWLALEKDPAMRRVLRERQIRMPGKLPPQRTTGPKTPVSLEAHRRALRDAGFRRSTVSWQDGGFCVLIGSR